MLEDGPIQNDQAHQLQLMPFEQATQQYLQQ